VDFAALPPVNRALMSMLLATNVFVQNTSLIAAKSRADPLHATATRGLAARNGEPH
jgi:PPE-repeat protein